MSVHTVLFNFTIDPMRICGDNECKVIVKAVIDVLNKHFKHPVLQVETTCDDGFFSVYKDGPVIISIRLFHQGILTLNIEYYQKDTDSLKLNFDV